VFTGVALQSEHPDGNTHRPDGVKPR
jgi:hypothetical protein